MGKMNLKGLQSLRENLKNDFEKKVNENKEITILVGMGTCGIAAGAKETMPTFTDQIEKMGMKNVKIKPTGCMGHATWNPP